MAGRYEGVRACLRRVLALKAELGDPAVDATVELADDPALGSFQAAAVAPLGPVDQQALLIDEGPDARLEHLLALLEDEEGYLRTRLEMG